MKHQVSSTAIIVVVAYQLISIAATFADDTAIRSVAADNVWPKAVLSELQRSHSADSDTFVVQSELDPLIRDGGGGACASAAAIDALQAVRLMAGEDELDNPHQAALTAIADQPALLDGRVTNDQLLQLMSFYDAKYLDDAELVARVQVAPDSDLAGEKWGAEVGPDLSTARRAIKIVSYTVTTPTGEVRGRHFVLLKERTDSGIVVVDPAKPGKEYRYELGFGSDSSEDCEPIKLLQPEGAPARASDYEINTVFEFTVNISSNADVDSEHSLRKIKESINKTAGELRGTESFLSPRVWREKTASYGLPSLDLPKEYGGGEWPATKMLEVFRHAGRLNLNFRDIVGGAHVRPLIKSKHPDVLAIVRQVAEGKGYVAITITEPTAGTDIPAIKSTSKRVDGGYLISGVKRFNARLDQATHVIIFTQGTTGVEGRLNVFVVPIDHPGLKIEQLEAHGLTGNSYGGLSFQNLFVPESHRIGEDGEGLRIFFEHFLYWRLMQTAAAIGTGEDALDQMADRIRTREVFGGPIGRFTHLQQPIGQHTTELRMAHSLAVDAAELLDQGDYDSARAIICGLKAEGVEISLNAVDAAMRAFGGEGYSRSVDLGDRLRDLNGLRIADGTTDVMRMEVVRQTYGEEFWEMAVTNQD